MAILSLIVHALRESFALQVFAALCALLLVSHVVLHPFRKGSVDLARRSIQLPKRYTTFIFIHSPSSPDPSFGLPLACPSFIAC